MIDQGETKQLVTYRLLDDLGFPGYRIGDDGSVWSCWRKRKINGGGFYVEQTHTWKQLKPWTIKGGYRVVGLSVNGKRHCKPVHHLVLEGFGHHKTTNVECCHNDGNPANNHLANLRWDTPKNNCKDRKMHGRWESRLPRGSKHHNAKLTADDVRNIRSLYCRRNNSGRKLAKQFGVDKSVILDIVNHKIWRHVK